jgi:hypothetical protein
MVHVDEVDMFLWLRSTLIHRHLLIIAARPLDIVHVYI